jgi:hypothetical protein
VAGGAPGGQSEYRSALCVSFLFKFFVATSLKLGIDVAARDKSAAESFVSAPKPAGRGTQVGSITLASGFNRVFRAFMFNHMFSLLCSSRSLLCSIRVIASVNVTCLAFASLQTLILYSFFHFLTLYQQRYPVPETAVVGLEGKGALMDNAKVGSITLASANRFNHLCSLLQIIQSRSRLQFVVCLCY